jgi:transcriptional regulator with XRE-family HTH domain
VEYISIGEIIKALRKERKMNQTQLAGDIMDRSTLAKIESGKLRISKDMVDYLFNRMGYDAKQFFPFLLSKQDFEAYELRNAFTTASIRRYTDEMIVLLRQMEGMDIFKSGLHRQHLLLKKANVCLRIKGDDYAAATDFLMEAIKITLPRFDSTMIHTYLLGSDDHEIIAMLARIKFETGEHDAAINMMKKLAQNIRNRVIDAYEKARSLNFVLYNLSRYFGQTGRYREELEVCNEAIESGEKHRAYGHLPQLNFNKAYAMKELKMDNDEITRLLYRAYYCALTHGAKYIATEIKKHACDIFGVSIPDA